MAQGIWRTNSGQICERNQGFFQRVAQGVSFEKTPRAFFEFDFSLPPGLFLKTPPELFLKLISIFPLGFFKYKPPELILNLPSHMPTGFIKFKEVGKLKKNPEGFC